MGPERLKNPKHPAQKPIKILQHIIEISSNIFKSGKRPDIFHKSVFADYDTVRQKRKVKAFPIPYPP